MPDNPLKRVVDEMAKQLRTTTFDLEAIERRKREMLEAQTEGEESEPGEPESFK